LITEQINAQNAPWAEALNSGYSLAKTLSSNISKSLGFVEIKKGIFIAVIKIAANYIEIRGSDIYKVEKLYSKRLCRLTKDNDFVKKDKLQTDLKHP
jgi:hypothetical protein